MEEAPEFPKLKIEDEKAAMRYLSNELDYALNLIAILTSDNIGAIGEQKMMSIIKDGRRILNTMRQVNDYVKDAKGYTIRKKNGWMVEQKAEQAAKDIKNMMDVVKSSVVQDIVNPKISQN